MTDLPVSLDIGAIPYQVEVVDGLHVLNEDGSKDQLNGYHLEHIARIQLREDLSPAIKRVVFMHELIHALLCQRGHKYPHEENMIEGLSYGLVDLFQRNPDLLPYLMNIPEGQSPNELATTPGPDQAGSSDPVPQEPVPEQSCACRHCHRP